MNDKVNILPLHPVMASLFPNRPTHWNFIDQGKNADHSSPERDSSVEILIATSLDKLDKEVFDRFPNLRMVASISVGFSNIDLDECRARNIAVTNAPGLNAADVADVAVTLFTSLLLRVPQNHEFIMTDQWITKNGPLRNSIRSMPVGIVGLGAIGIQVLKRLEAFSFEVKWWGPRDKPDISVPYVPSLEELAKECRGLIVCCRPGPSTYHLIDQAILDNLGADGVIVNVSRGNVIDDEALITSLKNKTIAGAGLDVFDPEPTNSAKWAGTPNIILSPHQGGTTYETLFAQAQLAQTNIENFLNGDALVSSVL